MNLRSATLADVSFENCLLNDVDFGGATLRRCTFPGSQLRQTDLSHVTLDQVDLRGAELGLILTPDSLRGATISTDQLIDSPRCWPSRPASWSRTAADPGRRVGPTSA